MFDIKRKDFPFNNTAITEKDTILKIESPIIKVCINTEKEADFNIGLYINSPKLTSLHSKGFLKQIHHILYSMEGICFDGTDIYVSKYLSDEKLFSIKLKENIEKYFNYFCRFIDYSLRVYIDLKKINICDNSNTVQIFPKKLQAFSNDSLYSCRMCQTLSPYHICIITPQKSGHCGGVDFSDTMLMYDINKYGPYGMFDKTDMEMHVKEATYGKIDGINLYSLFSHTLPVSPLAEILTAVLPDANAVVVLDRKYSGETPLGLDFEQAMNITRTQLRVDGITGHARQDILSPEFLKEYGGINRVAWMPYITKQLLAIKNEHFADEHTVTNLNELLYFIKNNNERLLNMKPII